MRKIFFLIFIGLLFINFVCALDCQYKDNNPYKKEVIVFYENGTELDYNLLEVKDIQQGYYNAWTGNHEMQFKVYNNYNLEINVTINYIFKGQLHSTDALIASKGFYVVGGTAEPGLDETTINFIMHTAGLEAKRVVKNFNNITCQQCPEGSGFNCSNDGIACNNSSSCGGGYCTKGICTNSNKCFNNNCNCSINEIQCSDNTKCVNKNSVQIGGKPICSPEECTSGKTSPQTGFCALKDGERCNSSSDCYSGICNIAETCGPFYGCPEGKANCNDRFCLTSGIKKGGEPYSCDWECESGTGKDGICNTLCTNETLTCDNRTCVFPSSKNAGEKYTCIQECKSNRGENGKCLMSTTDIIKERARFIAFCFILTAVGIWYFAVYKRNRIKRDIDVLKGNKDEIELTINNLKKEIEPLSFSIDKSKEKIKILKKQIQDSEGKAKEELEYSLRREEENQKERLISIEKKKSFLFQEEDKIKNLEEELKDKRKQLDKEKEEIEKENPQNRIKKLENKYKKEYEHGSSEVFYDPDRKYFRIRYKDGNVYDLHWKIYKDRIENNLYGKEVHHIDYDELNDELWNLIALKIEDHNKKYKKFFHYKIIKGDWKSGIQQLKDQLGMKDTDFPEHIRKRLNNAQDKKD